MSFFSVINPATKQVIDELPIDSIQTIAKKISDARNEQKHWKSIKIEERIQYLRQFQLLLEKEKELLALDLTKETGKPITQSLSEISAVSARIDFFIETTPKILERKRVSPLNAMVEEVVDYEPLGLIANISAWNYPYFVGLNVIVPALLTGNAVLYKPSEYASLSGRHITRLLWSSGLNEKLVPLILGDRKTGEALLDNNIDGVFFTGSLKTGQSILKQVRHQMIPIQLELGGKDGIYVCKDSDLNFAVPSIAEGAFYNNGQSCCSVERIFIHHSLFEKFKTKLVDEVKTYKIGDPLDSSTFIGPVTRPSHLEFLEKQIADSIAAGAEILLGGNRSSRKGYYFEPTIVDSKQKNFSMMKEESFGPIVIIESVQSDEEAIDHLNNSFFGLTAGVYSKNRDQAINVLEKVHTGTAYWNCCDRVSPRLPWSGRKLSGMGTTLSEDGIRCFTKSKAWHFRSHSTSTGE